jgi:hypothetical protein
MHFVSECFFINGYNGNLVWCPRNALYNASPLKVIARHERAGESDGGQVAMTSLCGDDL